MKLALLLFTLLLSLQAEDKTCYSLELFSLADDVEEREYKHLVEDEIKDRRCRVIELLDTAVVRCGCYLQKSDVMSELVELKQRYPEALITESYQYNFFHHITALKEKKVVKKEKQNIDDESLRLMYQVFIYNSALDDAYETAKRALQSDKKSLFWKRKLYEVTLWLNRAKEHFTYTQIMYKLEPSKALENEMINYYISSYDYKKAQILIEKQVSKNLDRESFEKAFLIYKKQGKPKKMALLLEKFYRKYPHDSSLLIDALEIYIQVADSKEIKRLISELKNVDNKKLHTLLSAYYFSQSDMQNSYNYLLKQRNKHSDDGYYRRLSDMAYYMGDYKMAVEASFVLLHKEKATLVDYERLSHYVNDEKVRADISLQAYKKFRLPYLFFTYANESLNNEAYSALANELSQLDANRDKALFEEEQFYYSAIRVYHHLGMKEERSYALKKAIDYSMNDEGALEKILWFLISNDLHVELNDAIQKVVLSHADSKKLYLVLASAYFKLQKVDVSKNYVDKLLATLPKSSVKLQLLHATLLQLQSNEEGFMYELRTIYTSLKDRLSRDKTLLHDENFLDNYLRVSSYFIAADSFEKLLLDSKPFLSKAKYDDIALFWAFRNSSDEEAHLIIQHLDKPESWMKLSLALNQDDTATLEREINTKYRTSLSLDYINAQSKIGSISKAQSLSFEALESNQNSQEHYLQFRDLMQNRKKELAIKSAYYNRSSLEQLYVKSEIEHYIARNYSVLAGLNVAKNVNFDASIFSYVPNTDSFASLGIQKKSDRATYYVKASIRKAIKSFIGAKVGLHYQISDALSLQSSLYYGDYANESTYLYLGGKKDGADVRLGVAVAKNLSVSLRAEYSLFSAQDSDSLGKGYNAQIDITQQLRRGYPDMALKLFVDRGAYDELSYSNNSITKLQVKNEVLLPDSYTNVGGAFYWGVANKNEYVRVWRPYFEFTPFYNVALDQVNFTFNAGYGAKAFVKDQIVLGIEYNQAVNGTQETLLQAFLQYKIRY